MDIEKVKDLKAQAYDCLAQIQVFQNQLNQINQQIAEEMNKTESEQENEVKK